MALTAVVGIVVGLVAVWVVALGLFAAYRGRGPTDENGEPRT